jgi:hypothetical protein
MKWKCTQKKTQAMGKGMHDCTSWAPTTLPRSSTFEILNSSRNRMKRDNHKNILHSYIRAMCEDPQSYQAGQAGQAL